MSEQTEDADSIEKCRADAELFAKMFGQAQSELERVRKGIPQPCVKVDGKKITGASVREWYEKIFGEALEAHEAANKNETVAEAMELIDVVTVCHSRLHAMLFSEEAIMGMQHMVNERNRERGRLK